VEKHIHVQLIHYIYRTCVLSYKYNETYCKHMS